MVFRQFNQFDFFVTRNFFPCRPVCNTRWCDVQFFGQGYSSPEKCNYFIYTHTNAPIYRNELFSHITKCKEKFQVRNIIKSVRVFFTKIFTGSTITFRKLSKQKSIHKKRIKHTGSFMYIRKSSWSNPQNAPPQKLIKDII